uniref:Putative c2h2-type zn-finger protein n=1 Tax=Culex tarsalis TaxID=7177 RepID=A0A1Q3EXQ3_CULTA
MIAFKLERFPHVCRTCLQPKAKSQMTSLGETSEKHGDSRLMDLLDELTFPIPEELNHLTPDSICGDCLEQLDRFLEYRKGLNYVLKFIFGMAQLKKGNVTTLKELFTEDKEYVTALLKRLQIFEKAELRLEDLLGEFAKYDIHGVTDVKRERSGEEEVFDADFLEDALVKVEVDDGGMIVEYLESAVKRGRGRPRKSSKVAISSPKVKRRGRPRKVIEDSDEDEDDQPLQSLKMLESSGATEDGGGDLSENDMLIERLSNASEHFAGHALVEMLESAEDGHFDGATMDDSDGEFELDEDLLERSRQSKKGKRNSSPRSSGQRKGTLQQCTKCKFKTYYPRTLEVHMEKKHARKERNSGGGGWHCKRCDQEFETKKELDKHKRQEHRDYMCDTCGLSFEQKFALETHRKRHADVRQYKCDYCPMEYFTRPEMLLHTKQVHLNAFEVKCPECSLSFKTKSTLNQHLKSHTNQRTHTCSVCGFGFKSYTHLNRHIKSVHQDVRYNCEHCEISYGRKDKLRMHMEKVHNIQTYFVCDICLQSYNARDKLEEHKTHHENPKPLQCGVCLAAYVTQEEFDTHLCITYKDNYICCERDFKYHFYYNKHMFLVHGLKTNVRVKPAQGLLLGQVRAMRKQAERCPRCEREFPTRNQKKQHMITCRGGGGVGSGGGDDEHDFIPVVMAEEGEGEKHVIDVGGGLMISNPQMQQSTLPAPQQQQQQEDDGCVTYEIEYVDNYDSKTGIVRKVNVV